MDKRRNMNNNKGYSLVEMIIVIAIIAIMCGAAMVTITLLNSAKAKEAGVLFDSEIAELMAKAKSQIVICDTSDGNGVSQHDELNFAIAVYKNNDGRYYILHGYYDKKAASKKFNVFDADNGNNGKGTGISRKVSIGYVPGNKNDGTVSDLEVDGDTYTAWVISYDKAGRCISGVGTYELNKYSDNSTIDTISIKANGSHQSK